MPLFNGYVLSMLLEIYSLHSHRSHGHRFALLYAITIFRDRNFLPDRHNRSLLIRFCDEMIFIDQL